MKTKEAIRQVIEGWGFPILDEGERNFMFRYQMYYVNVVVVNDDDGAIAATLTGFYTADDDNKAALALKACNSLNDRLMVTKLVLDSDNDVAISWEFFCPSEEQIETLLRKALGSIVEARSIFIRKYNELESEASLLDELGDDEE